MSGDVALQKTAAKPVTSANSRHAGLLLQRKCACGSPTSSLSGECAECGSKKLIQKKLAIGASNDPLEQEADRVADQVMAGSTAAAISSAPPRIQRFTGHASTETGAAAPQSVDRVLASPGTPLAPELRQDMEQRFGHDFSQVRVHADAAAERSAHEVNASAYTVAQDIVFAASRFAPTTHNGRRLIAHELTHVVQQSPRAGNEQLVQRSPEGASAEVQTAVKPRRKVVRETVYFDQNRIVYEFDSGASEERTVIEWNVRDPVPGQYRYTERGEGDDWKPSPPWLHRMNLVNPVDIRLWTTADPIRIEVNAEVEIQVVAGAAGEEITSFDQAQKALGPEMQELLISKNALRIRSAEDQYIAYQIVRDMERAFITPTELLTYQNEHPDTRRASSYAELRREVNTFLAETSAGRVARGEELIGYGDVASELSGDEQSYQTAMKPLAVPWWLRGNFTALADIYRESGDPDTAALFERAQRYVEQFEKVALTTGKDLLTSLESVLRVDRRYITAHDTPAYQRAQWARMQKDLQAMRGSADPLYEQARTHESQALMQRAMTWFDSGDKESNRLEQLAAKESGDANAFVAQAIPNMRAAPRFSDFPYKQLAQAEDADAVADIVTHFVEGKTTAVVVARERLLNKPEQLYKLDTLVAYVKQQMGANDDPIYDQVLRDRAAAIEARESWIDDLLMLLSIALSFVPGVGLVALAARGIVLSADLMALNRALDAYNQQALAFSSGLSSQAPSSVSVYLSALGPVASAADLAAGVAKAMTGGAKVTETAVKSAHEVTSVADDLAETATDVVPTHASPADQAADLGTDVPVTQPGAATVKPASDAPVAAVPPVSHDASGAANAADAAAGAKGAPAEDSVWVQLEDGTIREYKASEVSGGSGRGAEITTASDGRGTIVSHGEPPHGADVKQPNIQPGGAPSATPALFTPAKLNEYVPQAKGIGGPKRRLLSEERKTAKYIEDALMDANRGNPDEVMSKVSHLGPHTYTHGQFAGWTSVDLVSGNPGGLNIMRLFFRKDKNGMYEAIIRQVHGKPK
jgi:hypothetical protein